jgi:hypothetical protein
MPKTDDPVKPIIDTRASLLAESPIMGNKKLCTSSFIKFDNGLHWYYCIFIE